MMAKKTNEKKWDIYNMQLDVSKKHEPKILHKPASLLRRHSLKFIFINCNLIISNEFKHSFSRLRLVSFLCVQLTWGGLTREIPLTIEPLRTPAKVREVGILVKLIRGMAQCYIVTNVCIKDTSNIHPMDGTAMVTHSLKTKKLNKNM